ncbi:MAG: chemotaxis protein CheB [Thiohalobacteraceae bacterium]
MADVPPRQLRVALIAARDTQGGQIRKLLEAGDVQVILDQAIGDYRPEQVGTEDVDVLLVNLDEATSRDMDRLEALVEQSVVPILFNEDAQPIDNGWGRRLIAKLEDLAGVHGSRTQVASTEVGTATAVLPREDVVTRPALHKVSPDSGAVDIPPVMVWVLGASLGGPQALKLFFSHLPSDIPAGFIVAQHIGRPFVSLLAGQLDRVAALRVMPAEAGRRVRAYEAVLVPVDHRFVLTDDGVMDLRDEPIRGPYRPCIDDVMEEAARCYGKKAGAIVFSGLGEDGAVGAEGISRVGGVVWAQTADSCVMSSMPDAVRGRGVVTYSGTPEELARRLVEHVEMQAAAH